MSPPTPRVAPGEPNGFHVLLIDDDEDLCHLTADYLRPLGFQVESEHRGIEGVERDVFLARAFGEVACGDSAFWLGGGDDRRQAFA